MGELKHADDCQSHIVDVRGRPDECTCGADTRPRTEGRGEGEQVAWAYEYTNHLKGDRAPGGWLRAVAFEAPSRARVNAGFARNVQPLYASPIREPKISREALIKVLADHFGFRPYEQMAEDKSDLRGKVRDGYDVNEPTKSDLAEVADAILNLAPVAKGAGAEPGAGWVYNSPDTGMEYSTEHPLESGEIPDATDVRRSTFFEDWMFGEIGRLDAKVRELVVNLAPVGGRGEGWRPISEAPRDGSYILAHVADRDADDRWAHLAGRAFVVRHEGKTSSGYDLGWSVHPGFGGCADDWFSGWQPLPPPPQEQEEGSARADLSPASRSPDQHSAGWRCRRCGRDEIDCQENGCPRGPCPMEFVG